MKRIAVFGMGKLGLPLAAVLASRGYAVVGVDKNRAVVETINEGATPIVEPGLSELIEAGKGRLSAMTEGACAAKSADVIFIVVPTPSTTEGDFSTKYVEAALKEIGQGMQEAEHYQVVVLTSTVCPGVMDGVVRPLLESQANKKAGHDFGLCYNPEFIALGSVIRNMCQPDFILIGESDERAGNVLETICDDVCLSEPPVKRMSFINAELTKLAVNVFLSTKISYGNMIAGLCDKLPGADAGVVTEAIGYDSRIGRKCLCPGLACGGPCLPRDGRALLAVARRLGVPARLAAAADDTNLDTKLRMFESVSKIAARCPGTIGVLGLSYKPDTSVVEESAALDLVERLVLLGLDVRVYDPQALPEASKVLGERVAYAASAQECVARSEVVVFATPWPEFKQLNSALTRDGKRRTVIDPWRLLDVRGLDVDYVTPGCG